MSAIKPPTSAASRSLRALSRLAKTAGAGGSGGGSGNLEQLNAQAAAAQIAYFRAIPWCAAYLSQQEQQQGQPEKPSGRPLVIDQAVSRRLNADSPRDTLLSRTLNTPDTIPAYVTFYPAPQPPPPSAARPEPGYLIREVKALVALGHMVNGWEGVCHGGLVATLLDEVMGQVFAANKAARLIPDVPVMTAYLNTRYEKPVRTAGVGEEARPVLVTARMVRNEGRKYWMEGDVSGEGGEVLARAEALFIMLKGKL